VRFHPGALHRSCSTVRVFSHADVPYRIGPTMRCSKTPTTPSTSTGRVSAVAARVAARGADGKLVVTTPMVRDCSRDAGEKLLLLLLVKLTNLVPEGGIWMNTQRPSGTTPTTRWSAKGCRWSPPPICAARWSSAGVFLPTVPMFADAELSTRCLSAVTAILAQHKACADNRLRRRAAPHGYGCAGHGRQRLSPAGLRERLLRRDRAVDGAADALALLEQALAYIDQTLRANAARGWALSRLQHPAPTAGRARRSAISTRCWKDRLQCSHRGCWMPMRALALLNACARSALYRADQHSYILYPDRELPGFLAKNNVPHAQVQGLAARRPAVRTQRRLAAGARR
jgi:hypothetical protein